MNGNEIFVADNTDMFQFVGVCGSVTLFDLRTKAIVLRPPLDKFSYAVNGKLPAEALVQSQDRAATLRRTLTSASAGTIGRLSVMPVPPADVVSRLDGLTAVTIGIAEMAAKGTERIVTMAKPRLGIGFAPH